jgi:hypothetical protein
MVEVADGSVEPCPGGVWSTSSVTVTESASGSSDGGSRSITLALWYSKRKASTPPKFRPA